jgi:hypothetical protein
VCVCVYVCVCVFWGRMLTRPLTGAGWGGPCSAPAFVLVSLAAYVVFWVWNFLFVFVELRELVRMRAFYRDVLEVVDVRPPTCTATGGTARRPVRGPERALSIFLCTI